MKSQVGAEAHASPNVALRLVPVVFTRFSLGSSFSRLIIVLTDFRQNLIQTYKFIVRRDWANKGLSVVYYCLGMMI